MNAASKIAGAATVHAASHNSNNHTKRSSTSSKGTASEPEGGLQLNSIAIDVLSPLNVLSPVSSTGSASPIDVELEENTIYLSLHIEMIELSDIQQTFSGAGAVSFRFINKG